MCMNQLVLTRQAEAGLMEVPHAPMPGAGACWSVKIWRAGVSFSRICHGNNFTCVGFPLHSFHRLALAETYSNKYSLKTILSTNYAAGFL